MTNAKKVANFLRNRKPQQNATALSQTRQFRRTSGVCQCSGNQVDRIVASLDTCFEAASHWATGASTAQKVYTSALLDKSEKSLDDRTGFYRPLVPVAALRRANALRRRILRELFAKKADRLTSRSPGKISGRSLDGGRA